MGEVKRLRRIFWMMLSGSVRIVEFESFDGTAFAGAR